MRMMSIKVTEEQYEKIKHLGGLTSFVRKALDEEVQAATAKLDLIISKINKIERRDTNE